MFTIPQGFSATSGEEWNSLKTALSDAESAATEKDAIFNLLTAKRIYDDVFKTAALEVDPQGDALIENAFTDSMTQLTIGNIEQASLNRQIIDKTIYKVAFMQMESAIEEDDSEEFLYWFDVLDKKFSISTGDFKTNELISELTEDPSELYEYGPEIKEEILEIFKLKTLEELEEAINALENDDLQSAQTFTYEGLFYYRTLHPSVEEKLGQETAGELLHEMEEAIEVTMSGSPNAEILEELEHISSEVELIIREYEGGDTSEIGLALSGIKDRLELVDIEYSEAVSGGEIINQEEYDETLAFLGKATEIFNENRANIEELSSSDVSALEKNFSELDNIVTSMGDPNQVTILVGKSLNNIASLQEIAGGVVQIDSIQYIDEIERLLTQAKQEYHEGNSQTAFDLVSKAYLDNYEFVEGPLGEVDPELMEKIELDMREDLRGMIQSNVPTSEVDSQIDMILQDLEEARMVIPEFGAFTVMILLVAIISVIILSAKSRLSLVPRI